jgi:hypothetical protein
MPQSDDTTSRSGGITFSAALITSATSCGVSTCSV